MALTNIANRLTPSTPIEITFGAQPVATGTKQAVLIGHRAASGGTGTTYGIYQVAAVGDPTATLAEVDGLAGAGSEIGKMAQAFVKANSAVSTGARNFPPFKVVLLDDGDTDFGATDEALEAIKPYRADFIVGPYDASGTTNLNKLRDLAALLSGPDRDLNGQFGSTAVEASLVASGTALALNVDNQYVQVPYFRDTNVSPAQLVGVVAAAFAASELQLVFPYLGLDSVEVGGLLPATDATDKIIAGAAELSELALAAGLAPLTWDSANRVRIIRSRLTRVTIDGSTPATAYIDWQDVVPLYDFREDCYLILQQPQFKNKRATVALAGKVKDEVVRIALNKYQKQGVFQFVEELAKQFIVQPSASSRGRFDFFIPVDVVPILHVVAGNIQGTVFTL